MEVEHNHVVLSREEEGTEFKVHLENCVVVPEEVAYHMSVILALGTWYAAMHVRFPVWT